MEHEKEASVKHNKIVKDNDPALVYGLGLKALSTSKRVFVFVILLVSVNACAGIKVIYHPFVLTSAYKQQSLK